MTANQSSDYAEINITVAMISQDSFHQLQVIFVFLCYFLQYLPHAYFIWHYRKFCFDNMQIVTGIEQ